MRSGEASDVEDISLKNKLVQANSSCNSQQVMSPDWRSDNSRLCVGQFARKKVKKFSVQIPRGRMATDSYKFHQKVPVAPSIKGSVEHIYLKSEFVGVVTFCNSQHPNHLTRCGSVVRENQKTLIRTIIDTEVCAEIPPSMDPCC